VISPADIATVSEQISSTWTKINNREFYIMRKSEIVTGVTSVKSNNMAIALHELEQEEEQ
jgi:DNA helicase-2/ATP-dependent DNA helicase PcrA